MIYKNLPIISVTPVIMDLTFVPDSSVAASFCFLLFFAARFKAAGSPGTSFKAGDHVLIILSKVLYFHFLVTYGRDKLSEMGWNVVALLLLFRSFCFLPHRDRPKSISCSISFLFPFSTSCSLSRNSLFLLDCIYKV